MRTTRSILNFVTAIASNLLTLIVGLIAAPLLLRWMGDEPLGAFRVTIDWFAHLSLLELGLGVALLSLLASAYGRSDEVRLRSALASGIRAYALVAALTAAGGIAILSAIQWLVPVADSHVSDLKAACWVGIASTVLIPLTPFRALAEATQRGFWVTGLLGGQALAATALALTFAKLGLGVFGQYLAVVVAQLPSVLVLARLGLRRCPGALRLAIDGGFDADVWRALWRLNIPSLLLLFCGRVSLLSDNIVVAGILGTASVLPLYFTQRLAQLAQAQLQAAGNATWASLAELDARGDRALFNERLLEITRLVSILGAAVLAPLASYNQRFVELWVGPRQFGGTLMTLVATSNAFLHGLFSLWAWSFEGTGRARALVPVAVASASLNLALSVILTWRLGPVGPLLGTLASFLLIGLWGYARLLERTFGISWRALSRATLPPAALGAVCAAVLATLDRGESLGWVELTARMMGSSAFILGLAWALLFSRDERARWSQRLGALLRRPAVRISARADPLRDE